MQRAGIDLANLGNWTYIFQLTFFRMQIEKPIIASAKIRLDIEVHSHNIFTHFPHSVVIHGILSPLTTFLSII